MSDPTVALNVLERVQTLLREGPYTTSYKFALLRVLCDLSLVRDASKHRIELGTIAERFIQIYWRQTQPFAHGDGGAILRLNQSTSPTKHAKILTRIHEWSVPCHGRLSEAQDPTRMRDYSKLIVTELKRYVLCALQGERKFLYSYTHGDDHITMLPGASDALRQFYPLLCVLIESRWTRFVEDCNKSLRGHALLVEHLFGAERSNLRAVVGEMLDLQEGRCFYSSEPLKSKNRKNIHVDHFIPWSLARHEAIGNLVLASAAANSKKGDKLAKPPARKRWEERNTTHAADLARIALTCGLRYEPAATLQVAHWAYSHYSAAAS